MRRSLVSLAASLAVVVSGCGPASLTSTPGPGAISPPAGSPAASPNSIVASSFGDLPYELDLPSTWAFRPATDVAAVLPALKSADPAVAAAFEQLVGSAATPATEFVAARTDDPSIRLAGTTLDTGGLPEGAVLRELEAQNVDGIAKLPGIVGTPTADRLTLPAGETVRVRWSTHDSFGPGTGDDASIGFAFVVDRTAYTFVFSAPPSKIDALEPSFEAILATFRVRSAAVPGGPSPSVGTVVGGTTAPHDDPELEALLPARVAGLDLVHESYRGRTLFGRLFGMSDSDISAFAAELSRQGLSLDDVSLASDGRALLTDPPYFVDALRFKGIPANQLETRVGLPLGGFLTDHPYAGGFTPLTLGGKRVMRGTVSMVDQTPHQRGLPYFYEVGEIRFVVLTDDPTWAVDALRQLP